MSFELRKLGDDRAAILGGFIGMFVATIAVVIILLVFVLISGIVKTISGSKEGVAIKDVTKFGGVYLRPNAHGLINLVKVKFYVSRGASLDNAIQEAGYDK